jgi:hypothetical protein
MEVSCELHAPATELHAPATKLHAPATELHASATLPPKRTQVPVEEDAG